MFSARCKCLCVTNYSPVALNESPSRGLPIAQPPLERFREEDAVMVRILVAATLALGLTASANASTIVPGTSNPWLAGMPDGSFASFSDSAPLQSPVEVLLSFSPFDFLSFTSTGTTDHCDFGLCGMAGADGDLAEPPTGHFVGAENGIANVVAPIDSLIGVFLGPAQPDSTAAPGGLDFSTPALRDFATLSPALKQPFFIGDGRRNDFTTLQYFVVPAGATRLFLGTMDGYDWINNVGSLDVEVTASVPEPTTLVLVGAGLLGAVRRRVRRG
jgi:PEP-CTERM motif